MNAASLPTMSQPNTDPRSRLRRLDRDLLGVQPDAAQGDGNAAVIARTGSARLLFALRRGDGAAAALPGQGPLLQPAMHAGGVGEEATGEAGSGMTPTQYCRPHPCARGHPPEHSYRSRPYASHPTGKWLCRDCHAARKALQIPTLAVREPVVFGALRAQTAGLGTFERLGVAVAFWRNVRRVGGEEGQR